MFKIALGYLAIVYIGQKYMKTRNAIDSVLISLILALWNFTFSIFSGFAAYRLLPELFFAIKNYGFVGKFFFFFTIKIYFIFNLKKN